MSGALDVRSDCSVSLGAEQATTLMHSIFTATVDLSVFYVKENKEHDDYSTGTDWEDGHMGQPKRDHLPEVKHSRGYAGTGQCEILVRQVTQTE